MVQILFLFFLFFKETTSVFNVTNFGVIAVSGSFYSNMKSAEMVCRDKSVVLVAIETKANRSTSSSCLRDERPSFLFFIRL